jgi:hypothetical protein
LLEALAELMSAAGSLPPRLGACLRRAPHVEDYAFELLFCCRQGIRCALRIGRAFRFELHDCRHSPRLYLLRRPFDTVQPAIAIAYVSDWSLNWMDFASPWQYSGKPPN